MKEKEKEMGKWEEGKQKQEGESSNLLGSKVKKS